MTKFKRECGSCTLCCRLLPTEEIGSKANERCQHQCSKGCRIYARRPMSCALWNCRWLVTDDTGDQPRPDRSHIVLDMIPDIIRMTDNETGEVRTIPVIVAWVDPHHPDAFKSEAFLRYVDRQDMPILIRHGSSEGGGVLFGPKTTASGERGWHASELGRDMPTTLVEKARAIGAALDPGAGTMQHPDKATLRFPDGREISVAAGWIDER